MALRLRMARAGARNRAFYRIVVAENTAPRDGKFVEKVGTYNPLLPHDDKNRVILDVERIKHWLSKGVKPSERVAKFLGQAKIADMPGFTTKPIKSAPKAKAQERVKAKEDARLAAEEAAKEAANAPAPEAVPAEAAEAAPAVEAPAEAPAPETAEAQS